MSVVPAQLIRERRETPPRPQSQESSGSSFWQWVAIGVLMICWLAEATLCAARGF